MWLAHISHSVADPDIRGNNVIHCVADSQVKEMQATNSPVSYGKKVADPPESEILNVADPHLSQCGGLTCEGEQCDALCGRPTSESCKNTKSSACQPLQKLCFVSSSSV